MGGMVNSQQSVFYLSILMTLSDLFRKDILFAGEDNVRDLHDSDLSPFYEKCVHFFFNIS